MDAIATRESELCISGLILRGSSKPSDCPAFGKQCTPQRPLGATMVSAEGACAAYYQYGRYLDSKNLTAKRAAPEPVQAVRLNSNGGSVNGKLSAVKEAILRKVRQSAEVKLKFFEENAENIERCVEPRSRSASAKAATCG